MMIYTLRVQGADGRIVPASFKASSRGAAENMALARGYDVIVSEDDPLEAEVAADASTSSAKASAANSRSPGSPRRWLPLALALPCVCAVPVLRWIGSRLRHSR